MQLATRIESKVKKAVEKVCDLRGFKINRFIEDALIDKLEEMADVDDLKDLRREPSRPLSVRARSGFFDIIKKVLKRHEPLRINHKDGDVVVMSEEDYESLIETLEILSAPGFRKKYQKSKKQIQKGEVVSFADVFGD